MTHKVSSTELYDNQSIIVKMKRIEDKVDGAEESVSAAVVQAESAKTQAVNAAAQAQQAAGSIGSIAEQAQQAVNTANAASAAASAAVTQAEAKAQAVVDAATDRIKLDITQELGADIETAKDKADLAYTTANGFSSAIASMQSAVNSTQQEMANVGATAQNASQQATATDSRLTMHIASASNAYATKTELADKASVGDLASVVLTVNGKLSENQADAKYQPIGNYQPAGEYLTFETGDERYAFKGQGGDSVWGAITGDIQNQTDLKQYVESRTSGLVTSDTLNQETAWAKNTAVAEAKTYADGQFQIKGDYATHDDVNNAKNSAVASAETFATNLVNECEEVLTGMIDGKADKSEIPDVSNFVTKGEIAGVYTYRGTVSTKSQLPTEGNTVGDCYNVASTGMNYCFDGSEWDALGMDVDLSGYLTKDEAQTTYATNQLLIGVSNHADLLDTTKQDKLTPGEGITIEDNVISSTASGGTTITGITNAVSEGVLTTTIESGSSITSNNLTLLRKMSQYENTASSDYTNNMAPSMQTMLYFTLNPNRPSIEIVTSDRNMIRYASYYPGVIVKGYFCKRSTATTTDEDLVVNFIYYYNSTGDAKLYYDKEVPTGWGKVYYATNGTLYMGYDGMSGMVMRITEVKGNTNGTQIGSRGSLPSGVMVGVVDASKFGGISLTAGNGITIENGVISVNYPDGDNEVY